MAIADNVLSYCTNVHAGTDYATTVANLEKHAVAVRNYVDASKPLGVGLWLPASTAREVVHENRSVEFAEWLSARGLVVNTMNAFPYGDFHQTVVKHAVYKPTWAEAERLAYTLDCAHVLKRLLPEGTDGSISTLPIGWPSPGGDDAVREAGAANLCTLAQELARLEEETGTCIHIAIEPEPGCLLDTSADIIQFFDEHFLSRDDADIMTRYLRVCHDVCHASVMGEDQVEVLKAYRDAGIKVGKVQISSAIEADFSRLDAQQHDEALNQLRSFQEERYLHQTLIRRGHGAEATRLCEDLPVALDAIAGQPLSDVSLRVHFHVPLFLEQFGLLSSTQADVVQCLQHVDDLSCCRHFEVETYAWNVLPEALQSGDLADGIAKEMLWVAQQVPSVP
jgi:sugar phosphate isomerase/epimerase